MINRRQNGQLTYNGLDQTVFAMSRNWLLTAPLLFPQISACAGSKRLTFFDRRMLHSLG